VLPQIKKKTGVQVLLPSQLPKNISKAKCVTGEADASSYFVYLDYGECPPDGNASFAGSFLATLKRDYSLALEGEKRVKLARGIKGFSVRLAAAFPAGPRTSFGENATSGTTSS
jgi:hypothetical protein